MFWFVHALVLSLVMVGPATAVAAIGTSFKSVERTLLAGVGMFVFWTFMNWWVLYVMTPIVGFTSTSFYQSYGLYFLELIVTAIVLGMASYNDEKDFVSVGTVINALVLVCLVVFGLFWGTGGRIWTSGRAHTLRDLVSVKFEKPGAYPDTDPNHILMVSEQMADFKASTVLASNTQRNVGTYFKLGSGVLQSVDHHLYWLYLLKPNSWRQAGKFHGHSIGYVVVDAEDPDVPARLKLGYEMRFFPGGFYDHSIGRHLYKNGYAGAKVTDITLEVDDSWRPYFTAASDRLTLNFKRMVPGAMLLIDPQTGAIKKYSLHDIPSWVDRVYSAGTVKQMLNWWGEWAQAKHSFWNESSGNRYKVNRDPVLVYTKEGHPVWQAIMTSWNHSNAAAYLALFDARDNSARLYQVQNLTLENTAEQTILGSGNNVKRLEPVHLSLHKIYGQLTWVAPLLAPGGSASDSVHTGAFQGLALMRADDPNGNNVVFATNKDDALSNYLQKLAAGDRNVANPEQNSNIKVVQGVVERVGLPIVQNGQTVISFILTGDPNHEYQEALTADSSPDLKYITAGAKVRFTFVDVGSSGPERTVSNFDDLSLHLGK
ncbi:MAG TPA: hypothetical protein VFJ84_02370 [Candidatus Saccharimonadales bacterium]|nr:hypothetical protein [Candidatus Saccharimonadales bacterium]